MRRMLIATLVAVSVALSVLTAVTPGDAAASPVVANVDLAEPVQFGPGARWWTYEGEQSCSAGWIVNDGAKEYMYSAGHCAPKGAKAMLGHGRNPLGAVVISQADVGADGGDDPVYDVSAIELTEEAPVSASVPGFGEARRMMSRGELESARPDLCLVGQKSGLSCGPFEGVLDNGTNILFRAGTIHGDSGGAVFAVTDAGEVVAVGTLIGSTKRDSGVAIAQILDGSIDPSMHFGRL